jgi:uncharacterized damage-inducible protein DinB
VNHYGGKELAASFRTVRKNTIQIAEDIPEEKYLYRPTPESRSVAEMLTHIAVSSKFQEEINVKQKRTTMEGFDFIPLRQAMMAEEKTHRNKAEIIELLRSRGETFAGWLEGMSDSFLAESVSMPPGGTPPSRTRFDMLLSVKEHEMHHRAQLMLIERLIGIVPHLTRARQAQRQEREAQTAKN